MAAATIRRRRLALATLGVLAAAAFAVGAALGEEPGSGGGDSASSAEEPARWAVAAAGLAPEQLAGQRIVLGFSGAEPPATVRRMVRSGRAAGVVLFSDNLPSRTRGRRLVASLQRIPRLPALRAPLLVMVDQEGGRVKRLDGAPHASARQIGARGPAFARRQGRRTARDLRAAGVNVDLAPVLDVARPGGTIATEERAFGSTAGEVERTAIPFAAALQRAGVAATGKHFPGFGAARLNTDDAVQRIDLSREELRRVDEAPYRRFVAAGGELVMLSTAIYPAFSERPAAFTRSIATGELRDRLGFAGVSVTDALDSVAVRAFGRPAKAGLAAARAGADLLLFTAPWEAMRAQRALVRRLRAGKLDRAAFERSAGRVLRLRSRLPRG